MAYQLSLNDLPVESSAQPSNGNYQLSLADLPPETEASNSQNPSFFPRIGADIVSGLAQMGHGILNAPHNLAGVISPRLASYIPQQPDYNFGQLLGVNNPNLGDRILQGSAQYSPYLLGGEAMLPAEAGLGAKLANQFGSGVTFGLTQSKTPIQDALKTGALNAGLSLGGSAVGGIGSALKNYISQFAGKGILNRVGQSLSDSQGLTNQQAFNMAKQNFDNFEAQEKPAWDEVTNAAFNVDNAGIPFDNSNYLSSLQSQLEKLKGQSQRQSAYGRANSDALSMLQGYANDQTGTFTDAIEHNKALNQDYQNEITPGKSLPFSTVNFAKSNLQRTLQDNLSTDDPLVSDLKDALTNANSLTQQKNQIFNQIVNSGGKTQNSKFASFLSNKNENADPTTFVQDYIPNGKADGIQKMQQFGQMLGDEGAAKNVIKQNYFGNALTDDGIDPKSFLNKYNNLSDEQQSYLFNPDENKAIQALNKINKNSPKALNPSSFTYALHASVPGLIGALSSSALGHGWETGAIVGGLGYPAFESGLKQAFTVKPISNYFINSLTKAPGAPNPYVQMITSALTRGATLPQVINSNGGQ